MCLIVSKDAVPKTAEQDMKVFKILSHGNKAVARDFQYEPNTLYETEFERGHMMCADEAASKALDVKYTLSWPMSSMLKSIGQGFHFCFTEERAKLLGRNYSLMFKPMSFTVPKGAQYYEDESGLGVANKIIMGQPVTETHELQDSQG